MRWLFRPCTRELSSLSKYDKMEHETKPVSAEVVVDSIAVQAKAWVNEVRFGGCCGGG